MGATSACTATWLSSSWRRRALVERSSATAIDGWSTSTMSGRTRRSAEKLQPKSTSRAIAPRPCSSNYPPEYKVRRVNRVGIIKIFKIFGDCVHVSASLHGQLVGLQHERGMQWLAYFPEVD